jgi:serine/threonine protein kinase
MAHPDLSGYMLGDFLLIKQIGKGGHSTVYLCVQASLKRNAVVKVAHSRQPDEETRQRFRQEARLASRLDHPYAARMHSFGIAPAPNGGGDGDGWILWIAMEWIQGITIGDWLKQYGPMPPETLVPFFERIVEVVSKTHQLGIVHRDLKPSNIMVIVRQGHMEPRLLDFGIAKLLRDIAALSGDAPGPDDVVTVRIRVKPVPVEHPPSAPSEVPWMRNGYQGLTVPGLPLGTLEYMAPEQWYEAQTVDQSADTYSLGILLFEMLTGRLPFHGRSPDEYYRLHRYRDVPLLRGRFSPKVDQVIQRACSKYPRDRYSDVTEMASDLRAALQVVKREHLSATAQQWIDMGQPRGMLWGPEVIKSVTEPPEGYSKPECSFITRSQRHTQRKRWLWRSVIALLAVGAFVIAAMKLRMAHEQARMAQERARAAERLTEAVHTESEREQGRAALLIGAPEAQAYLTEAYKLDHLQSTAFMLARAIQHRLAELARFASTSGRTWSAAFSPDGKQLVTTDDKNAQVWDAQTYRLLFTLPHGDTVYQAVYSSDSTSLVTAGGDGTVRLWNAASGMLVRELRRGSTKPRYSSIALSPDDKLVAAIEMRGAVAHVWDAGTGVSLAELRDDAPSGSPSLAFSCDGHWLAMSSGNDARVFDTRTWAQVLTIAGPGIYDLSWDPTGPRLLTGSTEGDASIWTIPSGKRTYHLRSPRMVSSSLRRVATVRSRCGMRHRGSCGARVTTFMARSSLSSSIGPPRSWLRQVRAAQLPLLMPC